MGRENMNDYTPESFCMLESSDVLYRSDHAARSV
jgi:hypothetical protein